MKCRNFRCAHVQKLNKKVNKLDQMKSICLNSVKLSLKMKINKKHYCREMQSKLSISNLIIQVSKNEGQGIAKKLNGGSMLIWNVLI